MSSGKGSKRSCIRGSCLRNMSTHLKLENLWMMCSQHSSCSTVRLQARAGLSDIWWETEGPSRSRYLMRLQELKRSAERFRAGQSSISTSET